MVSSCCAHDCHNRQRIKGDKTVSFYRFPKDLERREAWVKALKRANWTPSDYSRLCSEHFISEKKSENPRSPDYIPSIFWYVTPAMREKQQAKLATFERWLHRLRSNQELLKRVEAASAKGLITLLPNTSSQDAEVTFKPTIGCGPAVQIKIESLDPEYQIEESKYVKDECQSERFESISSPTNAEVDKPTNDCEPNVLSSIQLKVEESDFEPQIKMEQPDPESRTEEELMPLTPQFRSMITENIGLNEQISSPSTEKNSFQQNQEMINYTGRQQFTLLLAPTIANQANAESGDKQTMGCPQTVQIREQAEALAQTEQELKSFKAECQALRTENLTLKERINSTSLNEESFREDHKKLKYYTGLANYSVFMDVLELLSPSIRDQLSLSKFQQLLLTLMRLRLNLNIQDLGYRFGTTHATVSRTHRNIVNIMHSQLVALTEIWPDAKKIILEHMKLR